MSKVEVHYELSQPLDDALLTKIATAHSIYGLLSVRVSPTGNSLIVQYDASRLNAREVDAALRKKGIAGTLKVEVLA